MRLVGRKRTIRFTFHPGMTLVEMLVVVALVVLIMAIMAEVIQLSSGTLTRLRAAQTLLQRSRLVETVIRDDLRSRTRSTGGGCQGRTVRQAAQTRTTTATVRSTTCPTG